MTSIEIFKSGMASGLKDFFEKYENSIKEIIDGLDSDQLLLKNFSGEQVTRLQNLTKSCNMALKLSNDFRSIIDLDEGKRKENLSAIKKAFRTEDEIRIGDHCLSSLVNSYITILEKLKIYFLFFIDWKKLGKRHKDLHGIGAALNVLREKYPENIYLNYFDTGARNSFAHYNFFFGAGSKINLCSEMFDKEPQEISLVDLMKGVSELNALIEGFYMVVRDKLNLPEINLERMEK